jgi:predicted GTPase
LTLPDATGADDVALPDNLLDLLKTQRNMIANLQRLREFAVQLKMDADETALIDEMLDRIERHRFTVAVVGEFKRGKSTLANALLGEEVLPADVLPTTATLNRVTYDLRPHVRIEYRDDRQSGMRSEEIPLHLLAEYVTKLTVDAQQRAARIKQAVIHYNNRFLHRNVDIVDTPGLNDDEVMTAVTLEVLPHTDAAIMVLMPEAPFSGYEGDFLNKLLLSDLGRVLFVVNAIDRIDDLDDRERLIAAIRQRIKDAVVRKAEQRFGAGPEGQDERDLYIRRIGEPQVFALSAADALEAKLAGDDDQLQRSRFPIFEQSLEHFLTHERGIVALQSLAARVIASGAKIVQRAAHMANAAKLSREEFDSAYQHAGAELDRLRRGLAEQLLRIDRTAEQTRQIVRPLLYQLIDETRNAVSAAIEAASITPAEIGRQRQRQVLERLGRDVARAADNASRVVLERAQFAVEREIEAELQRVAEFSGTLHHGLHTIDVRFSRPIETGATGVKGQAVEKTTALSVAIGGTLVSAVVVQSLLLPPVGAFVLVCAVAGGIAITARMIGQRLADALFAEERVERFRQSYKEAALVQIDQQFNAQYPSIERRFFDAIDETFTALKREVQRELGGAIEATQRTLDDLRMRRERQETLTDVQVKELERLQAETLRIVGKAQGLSSQLRDGGA